MYIKVVVISQLGCEILSENITCLKYIANAECFKDFLDLIYDLFPETCMLHDEDYKLYWRFSEYVFFEVNDYFSFLTCLALMHEKVLYLVVRDVSQWNVLNTKKLVDEEGALNELSTKFEKPRFYTRDMAEWYQMIHEMRKG